MPNPPTTIDEHIYANLADKVVELKGGFSGIGLGTVQFLLSHDAKVASGDVLS